MGTKTIWKHRGTEITELSLTPVYLIHSGHLPTIHYQLSTILYLLSSILSLLCASVPLCFPPPDLIQIL